MKNIKIINTKICLIPLLVLTMILSGVSLNAGQEAATGRAMSPEDTLRIHSVGSPALSPDGGTVLYTLSIRDMDDEDYKRTTHIWMTGIDGGGGRQLTRGEDSCSSPAWFPDGKMFAFLSSRGKKGENEGGDQIFFMSADGGEAWQVTQHEESIRSFEIAPDGESVLFLAQDPLSKEEKEARKKKDDEIVVDEDFRMTHLWHFDISAKESTRLTEGEYTVSDPQWSPGGKEILFVSRPTPKVDDSYASDIWRLDLVTKNKEILYENPGPDFSPRWSPDGEKIVFASNSYSSTSTVLNKMLMIPAGGGEAREYLSDFNRDFGTPIWAPKGNAVYWYAGDRTTLNLFAVDLASGDVRRLDPPEGGNYQWVLSSDGRFWVWVHSGPQWPGEIYAADTDLQKIVRLTETNTWLKEEGVWMGKTSAVRWKNSDGQWIEGVLTKPVNYQDGKAYPLILNPHGGPSGAATVSFRSLNQVLAGNGFMILQPNFRGSSNYGQEFVNANRKQWGIKDYDDCMTGVDYCIEQGWADPEKLICYGWSYGGYMSFWIVTQTGRFQAVSPGAGLPNLYSMYSTTDIPRYLEWFFGTPWDNEELYEKHSPIRYVKQVTSPVLILHGAEDARVPPSQAQEFYQALRDLEKEVTFVKYPREGHGISEPRHQLDRINRYIEFFCKHAGLKPVTYK
jgi:dipeptidyl aminopeptidase/acylaminoacyl peptidase